MASTGLAVLALCAGARPSIAGMTQDLADCTAADRKTSADACTRVMNSGRLPQEQMYIGYFNRAWSQYRAGDYDKARADFDKSIAANTGYADTYLSRAQVQHERGDREASLADLDLYLDKKGDSIEARVKRAQMFRWRGEPSKAFSELQSAAALDPADRKINIMRALVLSDSGEPVPARKEAEAAIAALPDAPGAYYARALIGFREHDLAAASADVAKALSLKKTFQPAHTLDGRIHEEQGDTAAARASYNRAIETSSHGIDALSAQAEARERLAALDGTAAVPTARVVASDSTSETQPEAAAEPEAVGNCRRFIPQAGMTVAVECPK
jgi:tetratricopeptide (TPR) repeat protein